MIEYKVGHIVKLNKDIDWVGAKDDRMLIIEIKDHSFLTNKKTYSCICIEHPLEVIDPTRKYQYYSGCYALDMRDFYSREDLQ